MTKQVKMLTKQAWQVTFVITEMFAKANNSGAYLRAQHTCGLVASEPGFPRSLLSVSLESAVRELVWNMMQENV